MRSSFLTLLTGFMFINTNVHAQHKINFLTDSARVLYIGLDNNIIVPKGASLSLTDAVNSCAIAKINEVTFSAKPMASVSGKEIKMTIQHKGKSVSRVFKVKNTPIPSVYIGAINIGETRTTTKKEFLSSAANGVRISFAPEEMLKMIFKITRYHLKIKIAGVPILDETIQGGKFPEKAMKLFKDKSQYSVEISEIFGEGPNGAIRTTNPLPLEVK